MPFPDGHPSRAARLRFVPDPVTFQRALRRIAEQRIRDAIAAGAFDNLPGAGKPIPDIDRPYDPKWWIKSWLARERLDVAVREADPRYRKLAALEELRRPPLDPAGRQPAR